MTLFPILQVTPLQRYPHKQVWFYTRDNLQVDSVQQSFKQEGVQNLMSVVKQFFKLEQSQQDSSNEESQHVSMLSKQKSFLTLLHSERPKLYSTLAFLSVIGLILKTPSYLLEL